MKFGLYLVRKGVITADQLVAALEMQHSRQVPIGQLAIEEAILSARQVFKILRCQSGMPHELFGEVAVGMGFMSRAELERLLLIQSDRKSPLMDILVRQGAITWPRADEELLAYRREMERRNVVMKRRIPSVPHLPSEPVLEAGEVEAFAISE